MSELVTAKEWFSLGARVPYDPVAKKIVVSGEAADAADAVHVFQRVVRDGGRNEDAVWMTFLPGFPDGSFSWAIASTSCTSSSSGRAIRISQPRTRTARWSALIWSRRFGRLKESGRPSS